MCLLEHWVYMYSGAEKVKVTSQPSFLLLESTLRVSNNVFWSYIPPSLRNDDIILRETPWEGKFTFICATYSSAVF